jgi:transcriptional regulator with XRE-family HTH domain
MRKVDKLSREEEEKLRVVQRNCVRFRHEMGDNVTQQDVADLAGISVFSVSRYEGGRGIPGRDELLQLAQVFGRTVEDFYNPNPPAQDKSRSARFGVQFKTIGPRPPGFDQDLAKLMSKYHPDFVREVDAIKRRGRQGKKR